jgi:NifB/MoaA-like Fe-S oxidoreductase
LVSAFEASVPETGLEATGVGSMTLVTGTLFAPVLRKHTSGLMGVNVVPVVNRFFGETVTVAGLLTAQDVVEALSRQELGQRVVLPAAMFGGPEGQSLDGKSLAEVECSLGRGVTLAHTLEDGLIRS